MTQRTKLEAQIQQLTRLLEAPITPNRGQLANELRSAVEQLQQLDKGEHWTQVKGETLGNIASREIKTITKRNGA